MPNGEVRCIDDEIPFEIPESWCWVRLQHLTEIVRGGSPRPAGSPEYYNGTIPFLKVADLTKDSTMFLSSYTSTIKEAGLSRTRMVAANTLLLTNSGATLGVPKICTFNTTFNDGIAAFLNLSEEIKVYVYWFLCAYTDIYRGYNQGTAQPNLNTDIIKSTLIPIPPINEQNRIIDKLKYLLPIIESYSTTQERLDVLNNNIRVQLKKSILQEAIQGRLVPQDPSDEPATKLLERIRTEKQTLVKQGKLKSKDITDSIIYKGDDNKYYEQIGGKAIEVDSDFDFPNTWKVVRLADICRLIDGVKKQGKYICLDAKYLRGKSSGDVLNEGKFIVKGMGHRTKSTSLIL